VGENEFTRHRLFPAFAGMHGPPLRRVLLFLAYLSVQMVEIHGARIAPLNIHATKKYLCKAFVLLVILLSTGSIEQLLL
jgi:hypothetical protein